MLVWMKLGGWLRPFIKLWVGGGGVDGEGNSFARILGT